MSKDSLYEADWIEFYDKLIPENHYKISFKKLLNLIKIYNPNAKKVLELACGTGRYTKYFSKHGFNVKGIDISKAAIQQAKKRVKTADFCIADMTKLKENQNFDIIACMFESFRYHKSFIEAQNTLKKSFAALKPKGIFFCDFGIFPPSKKPKKPQIHNEVKISGRKIIIRDETIYTKDNFDIRQDHIKIFKLKLLGKKQLILEKNLKRSPLLRISEKKMKEMMKKAGFQNIKIIPNFTPDSKQSRLFFGQKL